MSQATDSVPGGRIGARLLDSRLLQLALGGAIFVLGGALIDGLLVTEATEETWGIWAAILPVWGSALIATGLSAYVLLWWLRS